MFTFYPFIIPFLKSKLANELFSNPKEYTLVAKISLLSIVCRLVLELLSTNFLTEVING